jgi:uncharacterized surface protein with fasciclin (FAS1) repeats
LNTTATNTPADQAAVQRPQGTGQAKPVRSDPADSPGGYSNRRAAVDRLLLNPTKGKPTMKATLIATTLSLFAIGTASAECSAYKAYGEAAGKAVHNPAAHGATFVRAGGYTTQKAAQKDIVDTAVAAGSFSTLVEAVQAAGLAGTLKGDGPYTVFAPTDEAFAKLPAGTLEALLADKDQLTKVLTYHVVPGKLDASQVTGMTRLATVEGSDLPVSSISITDTDIMTSNGIIHVIDEVLIPAS